MGDRNDIQIVGAVGAGFMGSGIAESAARAGMTVVVHEPLEAPLERSRERVAKSVAHAVRRGKLDDDAADALQGRISWSTDLDPLADPDLVIEAVTEDPQIKGDVFAALDRLLSESALLASNTSSIPIAELAARTEHRGRVVGLHFFSPVPVMKLVEIVVAIDTAPEAV
jgi:3-hydroxybutyryl-CoA dehydrogenase